jgi:hypothetical protein
MEAQPRFVIPAKAFHFGSSPTKIRHSGESRNPVDVKKIPDFAGMTEIGSVAFPLPLAWEWGELASTGRVRAS